MEEGQDSHRHGLIVMDLMGYLWWVSPPLVTFFLHGCSTPEHFVHYTGMVLQEKGMFLSHETGTNSYHSISHSDID